MLESEISNRVADRAYEIGFHAVGFATIDPQATQTAASHLQTWIDRGYHADMAWMKDPRRQDIYQVMPDAKTVISLALNYYTPHQRAQGEKYAKIARYAWGRDYHKVLTTKLKQLTSWLSAAFPGVAARYYVDTGPIQDKYWAQAAGIGWIGKNGNVISRKYGSWIFLGEIVTNLELTPATPHAQHCGTCTRCLDACPTGAIVEPFIVDANRCIAYHTIENRDSDLPLEIINNLQGWVAGCDICQDVCPWNQKFSTATDIADFQPYSRNLDRTFTELRSLDEAEWDRSYRGSALRRIKPAMWRRNAIANLHDRAIPKDC
jgi:epoxyqueuosine reductase